MFFTMFDPIIIGYTSDLVLIFLVIVCEFNSLSAILIIYFKILPFNEQLTAQKILCCT